VHSTKLPYQYTTFLRILQGGFDILLQNTPLFLFIFPIVLKKIEFFMDFFAIPAE